MADRLCLTDDRMVPCPVAGLEAKLHGMTMTMQRWRSLAGQMTEERGAAITEAARWQAAYTADLATERGRVDRYMDERDVCNVQVSKLEQALTPFAFPEVSIEPDTDDDYECVADVTIGVIRAARGALAHLDEADRG